MKQIARMALLATIVLEPGRGAKSRQSVVARV